MGWNFGAAIIDFDFRTACDELEPDLRKFSYPGQAAEKKALNARLEGGQVLLRDLGIGANEADAPISFSDATSRSFDDVAIGFFAAKTVIAGALVGRDQEGLVARFTKISQTRGPVLVVWCNDAASTYTFSVYRDGVRVRFSSAGPNLAADQGAPVPGEPPGGARSSDALFAVLAAFAGRPFPALLELELERFDL